MAAWGARVVEIKTGYGLDLGSELRLLQAIEGLRDAWRGRIDVVATAMPAHAIPPERKSDPDRYVREVCDEILPAMASSGAKLDFVDVFIERGYFSVAQADAIAGRARELGLAIKAHVDEFEDVGGVPWAVDNGAVSVEHLLVTSAAHQRLLAESDTVAVCLPLTSLFLREDYAPMRQLIDLGGLVAIATDCNPGSAMSTNLHLAMQLAVLRGGLTPQEAIRAVTNAGAMALGGRGGPLQWDGSLRLGERFVATTLDVPHPDVLFYQLGSPPRAVQ